MTHRLFLGVVQLCIDLAQAQEGVINSERVPKLDCLWRHNDPSIPFSTSCFMLPQVSVVFALHQPQDSPCVWPARV